MTKLNIEKTELEILNSVNRILIGTIWENIVENCLAENRVIMFEELAEQKPEVVRELINEGMKRIRGR